MRGLLIWGNSWPHTWDPLPNKRLKLTAPDRGKKSVCVPASCVLVSSDAAPEEIGAAA